MADELLEACLCDFRDQQPSDMFERFRTTSPNHVKQRILNTQASQDRLKNMVNWSRMASFVKNFQDFQIAARLTSEQAAGIWGPVQYILKVSSTRFSLLILQWLTKVDGQ